MTHIPQYVSSKSDYDSNQVHIGASMNLLSQRHVSLGKSDF